MLTNPWIGRKKTNQDVLEPAKMMKAMAVSIACFVIDLLSSPVSVLSYPNVSYLVDTLRNPIWVWQQVQSKVVRRNYGSHLRQLDESGVYDFCWCHYFRLHDSSCEHYNMSGQRMWPVNFKKADQTGSKSMNISKRDEKRSKQKKTVEIQCWWKRGYHQR